MRPDTEAQPHYHPAAKAGQQEDPSFLCDNPPVGCRQMLPIQQRDAAANLCRRCVALIASEFRVPEASVPVVVSALYNLPWYQERFPAEGEAREFVRAQLLALEVAVNGASPRELAMAQRFRTQCPWFIDPVSALHQVGRAA